VLIVQCSLTLAKPTETVSRDSSCALIFNHFSFAFPKDFLPLSKQCERGHDVIGPQRARRTQVEPFPRQYPAQIARHAATGSACRAANAGRRCPGACLPYSDDFLRELMCLYAFVTVSAAIWGHRVSLGGLVLFRIQFYCSLRELRESARVYTAFSLLLLGRSDFLETCFLCLLDLRCLDSVRSMPPLSLSKRPWSSAGRTNYSVPRFIRYSLTFPQAAACDAVWTFWTLIDGTLVLFLLQQHLAPGVTVGVFEIWGAHRGAVYVLFVFLVSFGVYSSLFHLLAVIQLSARSVFLQVQLLTDQLAAESAARVEAQVSREVYS